MNQVVSSRVAASRSAALLVLASTIWIAACDPSPASRALRAGSAAAAPIPPELAELPLEDLHGEGIAEAPSAAADGTGVNTGEPETPRVKLKPALRESASGESARGSLHLLGTTVAPGTSRRLTWSASQIFESVASEAPVLIVNGREPGPTLCLTAAIHGDELNGIEMVRRVMHDLDPDALQGAVIGIPIVNLQGFRRGSRYLPDRRDLNRYFPGNPDGSSAARIAYSLFEEIIRQCNALVDLHTGSFYRTNLPQLRADLRYGRIRELTEGFGGMVVLHSVAAPGTLRRAATDAGIPAITLEAGEPQRMQSSKVSQGVNGILTLLDTFGMVDRVRLIARAEPVFYQSTWVRADHGGILFSVVRLGQVVQTGDVLGTVTDPITNEQNLIYSPARGRVLGMALNQVVMPGFAAFRIGIETDAETAQTMLASLDWMTEPGDTAEADNLAADEENGGDSAATDFVDSEESSE